MYNSQRLSAALLHGALVGALLGAAFAVVTRLGGRWPDRSEWEVGFTQILPLLWAVSGAGFAVSTLPKAAAWPQLASRWPAHSFQTALFSVGILFLLWTVAVTLPASVMVGRLTDWSVTILFVWLALGSWIVTPLYFLVVGRRTVRTGTDELAV